MNGPGAGLLVVGIGNPDRGDDGIGPLVALDLSGRLPSDATLIARAGDILSLIDDWSGYDTAILIDAVVSGAPAGTIHRLDLTRDPLPPGFSAPSTHAFGIAEAVELARALDQLPRRVILYALEGANFDPGVPMTAATAAAAPVAAARIAEEVHAHA